MTRRAERRLRMLALVDCGVPMKWISKWFRLSYSYACLEVQYAKGAREGMLRRAALLTEHQDRMHKDVGDY